jgi:hypothetical protein
VEESVGVKYNRLVGCGGVRDSPAGPNKYAARLEDVVGCGAGNNQSKFL